MSVLGCGKFLHKNAIVLATAALVLPGCMSIQAIEPVISPPGVYQRDNRVMVEFVHPSMVGIRCAERGVRFLGVPGLNSGACADAELITMANPCFTLTGGWYAETLCHELAHVNGWPHDHRGGLLFARHEPIRRAGDSPEALALAAAREAEAQTPQGASMQLAAAAPSDIVPVEPLVINLASVGSSETDATRGRSMEVAMLEPSIAPALRDQPMALAQEPVGAPIAVVTIGTDEPQPLDAIQTAALSPVVLRGTSVGSYGGVDMQRLGLRSTGPGFTPALPAPLP